MAKVSVQFRYLTGLKRNIFKNARLVGSWDSAGLFSPTWSETPMTAARTEDGCPSFSATAQFDPAEVGKTFQWGVRLDAPGAPDIFGMPTEVQDANSTDRSREFTLLPAGSKQVQEFYFTYVRRLGARKFFAAGSAKPNLRFAVWAPNAQNVEIVFGKAANGYIANDGDGIDPARPVLKMKLGPGGIWQSDVIPNFSTFEGAPYMYRIKNAQGNTVLRSDIFSRNQIGRGATDPNGAHYTGLPADLDGTKSCSLVVSLDTVARDFPPGAARVSETEFWQSEFTPGLPVPDRLEDLIIYELHVNALGFGLNRPGNLSDALALLPQLADLGINAIELLPMSEFFGNMGWGYGDSHHFVVESSAGGRDEYKYFVRECHRRGIAVIQDVCYNHFDNNAERAEWQYDSTDPQQNIYYWYEGKPADYSFPEGGYIDNGSSGWAPRYGEEIVRQLFVSSAAAFVEEFHVDGLRVDLTQAFHRDNSLHANGWTVASANQFGAKLLREWSRTLRMIKPSVMLIAEDHSGWNAVTQLPEAGGLGFSATWFASFYHNLIGDSNMAGGSARLLKKAGLDPDGGLNMEQFSGVLFDSQYEKIVYHESHDEAGNADGTERTILCAVNDAPLFGATRDYAEARCRVVLALSLFSAGTPMFLMGEEIGAQKRYTVNNFIQNREDLTGERTGTGAKLFRFYQDAIRFRKRQAALRSRRIDIIHALGANRVIAFTRTSGSDRLLIIASLRNEPFLDGYVFQTDPGRLPGGAWRELFNSDAGLYGGHGVGNFGADIPAANGRIEVRIPANGVLAFQLVS
jgi:1,4-alpha-glucan branching enzyme